GDEQAPPHVPTPRHGDRNQQHQYDGVERDKLALPLSRKHDVRAVDDDPEDAYHHREDFTESNGSQLSSDSTVTPRAWNAPVSRRIVSSANSSVANCSKPCSSYRCCTRPPTYIRSSRTVRTKGATFSTRRSTFIGKTG